MLKKLLLVLMLVVCCYCEDNNELLTEETRAKKKKRSLRLLAMIALFLFSKVAIFKVASFFFFLAFFQKLFSLGGLLLGYLMQNQVSPAPLYGSPSEYNTLGYSYNAPENEPVLTEAPTVLPDFNGAFNWFLSKTPQWEG